MTKKFTIGGVVVVVVLSLFVFFKDDVKDSAGGIEFNTGKVVYGELAENVLQRRTIVLTQAEINDLSNDENGIEIIPSPGSDKVIVVESIVGFNRFASEAWSRGTGESFEIKWNSGALASGANGWVSLGASFSNGFLTRGAATSTVSKSMEVWRPSGFDLDDDGTSNLASSSFQPTFQASSSAVVLTGLVNPTNAETTGITDFVFEVIYRILTKP